MGVESLGEDVLTLKVDGKEYRYELNAAKGQVQDLDKVHKKSEGTLGDLKLAYVAVAAGIRQVIKFAGELIDAYLAQEKADTRLRAAIKITGQERTANYEGLKAYASMLQSTIGVEDEAAESSMGLLMQMANLNEKGVKQALPLIADFANLMGMDLNSAAELFAKTLSSDTNALSRYGIQIQDGLDPSQKFAAVLEQMEEKAGGFSAELMKSTGGQIKQFQNQIGELKETLGGFLAEALLPAVKNMNLLFTVKDVAAGAKNISKMGVEEVRAYMAQVQAVRDDLQAKMEKEQKAGIMGGGGLGAKGIEIMKKSISDYDEMVKLLTEHIKTLEAQQAKTGTVFAGTSSTIAAAEEKAKKAVEEKTKSEEGHFIFYTVGTEHVISVTEGLAIAKQHEAEAFEAAKAAEIQSIQDVNASLESALTEQDRMAKAKADAEKKAAKEAQEAWKDSTLSTISLISSFASQIGGILRQMNANRRDQLEAEYEAEKARIESSIDDETEREKALEALDKEYAQKKYAAEVDSFNVNKAIQLANVAINTASAIIKFLVDPGGFAGIGLSVAAGAIGAVQAGVIAAQVPPPPPALAEGGSFTVPPGYPNDSYPMRVQSGEHVDVTPAGESKEQRITIVFDGRVFADFITKGTRDKRILISSGAIVR